MKYATLNFSSNGDNTVVVAVTNKRIRVVAGVLSFSGNVNAKFLDGLGGTLLAGLYYGAAGVVVPLDFAPEQHFAGMAGHFETSPGSALVLNLSAGTAVGGHLVYQEVN